MTTVTNITPETNPYNTTMENRTRIERKDRDTDRKLKVYVRRNKR